ncbi:Similar to conserved hypothetical protein [Ajellomyces capsulatus NAm1]; acc. no. XP_001537253 [Pyronema omphalodes CBS 100304]|uniref:Uncharacterized protein n=1 Tax=Pyronema omphalodes (strain CBS 100304) TaxID=1076935 RepID=U4LJ17_PYROM|nr:Similar to conserved hypothetical protein [Ajellomyces capsulatus NAm1]; acc. no. XP_001537253 [Pyronema omphalodes CBS 100304]
MFRSTSISGISLDAAGLVALADLNTIAQRTAIVGSASLLDCLVLAPGIDRHQAASEINLGEQPATAALTTGYVFRVENQATVRFLQRIGETGKPITVKVSRESSKGIFSRYCLKGGILTSILFLVSPFITLVAIALMAVFQDWRGLGVIMVLIVARLINVIVIRRRSQPGWRGKLEPGEYGNLLVLVSQDRWIRIKGLVDDLKMVTSGQWLRNTTSREGFAVAFATLLVYATAALAGNASKNGSITILFLLLVSISLLGLSNEVTRSFHMHGCVLKVRGPAVVYVRRLELAEELIKSSKRKDWALGLGMIRPEPSSKEGSVKDEAHVIPVL